MRDLKRGSYLSIRVFKFEPLQEVALGDSGRQQINLALSGYN